VSGRASDNDGAQGSLDAFLGDVAPIRRPRVEPGRAALIAMQPPEHRALVEQVLTARAVAKTSGRAANQSGQRGESWVTAHHERALERGLAARIDHVGPPTSPHVVNGRVQKDRRGRVIVVVTGLAPPDYLGTLCDGRSLAVEAKRRAGRLHAPLSAEELAQDVEDVAAIERHQADYLSDVAAAGGLGLVVVTFVRSHQGRAYEVRVAVPWPVVAARWTSPRGGRPSVGPEELEDYRLPPSLDCYLQRFVVP
jgi:hypothetical protein